MSPKGRLAQLVERPVYTGMVRGSSPLAPTKVTGVGVYLRPFLLSALADEKAGADMQARVAMLVGEAGSRVLMSEAN